MRSIRHLFLAFLLPVLYLSGCGDSDPFPASPTPTVTSLNPTSLAANSPDFSMTLNGSGFVPVSKVIFNFTPVETTFVSESQLDALIPGALIFFPACSPPSVNQPCIPLNPSVTYAVYVDNPDIAGGTSAFAFFTITP